MTVDGCLIRGNEYAEVRNLSGYVLRDVQTVEPNATASASPRTSAPYGTETTGRATASSSVSGQNTAGVEASKGNVGANASIKGSEVDHTTTAENNEQKGTSVGTSGAVGTSGSSTDNVGVTTPSTDQQGSTPGAGATAEVQRNGSDTDTHGSASTSATGTTGTAGVTAYMLEGVTQPATYVGKRVEITGMLMNAPSTQSANAHRMSRLRIATVKVIPGSCAQ